MTNKEEQTTEEDEEEEYVGLSPVNCLSCNLNQLKIVGYLVASKKLQCQCTTCGYVQFIKTNNSINIMEEKEPQSKKDLKYLS